MKKLLFTGLFAALIVACFAQKPYKVVFYNFENLFDTIRNPEIYDEEFTPEGPKKWNTPKYTKKINNLSRVLFDIAAINKDYPVVIGVSEIENRNVMEDVIATPKLAPANYRIVHYDSPDARGVDVAFYYRPDVFKLEGSAPIPFTMESLPNFRTRDVVTMWGTIDGEPFYFMVAHWPSRLGGKEASAPKRERAAEIMRHAADSVLAINPATKVVMMGDFNDDATDKSITEVLGAEGNIRKLQPGGYYNPFIDMLKAGIGFACLPRPVEPVRQYRRVGEPRYRLDGFAQAGACPQGEILRQYFPCPLSVPAGRPVQGLPAAYVRGQQFPGGIQRSPSRIHLHR